MMESRDRNLDLLFPCQSSRILIALFAFVACFTTQAFGLLSLADYRRTVSATGDHSIVLKDNGTVWASGSNSRGQLGVDPAITAFTTTPIQVPGLAQIVAVAVGDGFSLALSADGTVYSWGGNEYGQLGRTPGSTPWAPASIPGLTGIGNIAADGGGMGFAIRTSDGAVFGWGNNNQRGLGLSTPGTYYSPTQIPNLTGIVKVDSGLRKGVALTANGQVYQWGSGGLTLPSLVTGVSNAKDVAAAPSPASTVAVLENGSAVAFDTAFRWTVQGSTDKNLHRVEIAETLEGGPEVFFLTQSGALYSSDRVSTSNTAAGALLAVPSAPLAVEICSQGGSLTTLYGDDMGGTTLMLRDSAGRVFGKGRNRRGTLGDGTMTLKTSPAQVQSLTGVKKVVGEKEFCAAMLDNGEVWIWGDLDGHAPAIPTKLNGLGIVKATDIATGSSHLLVRGDDSRVYSWGYNTFGQLGTGNTTASWTLIPVPGITTATKVAAAFGSSYCLLANGTVKSWGENGMGQLGTGATSDRLSQGNLLAAASTPLANVSDIVARDSIVFLVRTDNTVRTCGLKANAFGDLSLSGSFLLAGPNSTVKESGVDITNVAALSVGGSHTIARLTNGTLMGWGNSMYGQLGYVTGSTVQNKPAAIPGVSAASSADFGCGAFNTFTLTAGALRGWGKNQNGELGDGTTNDVTVPPALPGPITGLKAVTGMTSGTSGAVTFGIKASDGTLWAWGDLHEACSGVWRPEFSQMAIRLIDDSSDLDQDGLEDAWEIEHFGSIVAENGGGDPDGDGVSNIQEFGLNTKPFGFPPVDPTDSDNDGLPDGADPLPMNGYNRDVLFTNVGGDFQAAAPNTFVDDGIQVRVTYAGQPIENAPVTFRITSINGAVAPTPADPAQRKVTAMTNAQGIASIRVKTGVSDLEVVELTATLDNTLKSVSFKALTSVIPTDGQLIRLKASEAVADADNRVSVWHQTLGIGAYATQTGGLRALKTTAAVGPVVEFDGDNDYYSTIGYSVSGGYSAGFTAFFVMHPQASSSDTLGMVLSGGSGGLPQNNFSVGIEQTGTPAYPYRIRYQSGSNPYSTGPDTIRTDNYALYSIVHKPNEEKELILYRNGVEVSRLANVNLPVASANPHIGKNFATGRECFKGGIAELVTYNRALSDDERVLSQNTLMSQYGLSAPPVISIAGTSNVRLPNLGTLTATVTDESPVKVLWETIASDSCGAANVQLNSPTSPETTIQFDRAGVYTFRMTATEGLNVSQKEFTITVDTPPVVKAGADLVFSTGETGELRGSVTDDGRPASPGSTTELWTKLSGPGTTTFTPANAASATVKFSSIGSYVLKLEGNDGGGTAVNDIANVTVNSAEVNPPNYIRAYGLNNRVRLTWVPRAYETTDTPPSSIPVKYTVKRSTSQSGPFTVLTGAEMLSVPTFQDTSAVNGSTYYYVVSATKDPQVNPVTSTDSTPVSASPGISACGPVDVAIIFDNTGSMGGAIDNVKTAILSVMSTIEETSQNGPNSSPDYRLALVSPDNDSVNVRLNFQSNNRTQFESALKDMPIMTGGGTPESTDECLNTVVNELPAAGRSQQGDFLPFRSNVRNVIIVITDAVPGGFDSEYFAGKQATGTDEYNAHSHAVTADRKCLQINALAIGYGVEDSVDFMRIMADYALTTGGLHYQTPADGSGAAAAIADMIESCVYDCCRN